MLIPNNPRFTTAIGLCFCLVACASPQTAREKGAVATYTSTKAARVVTDCVASAWESAYGGTTPVNVRPLAAGYSLQVSVVGNTQVLLDVTDVDGGSVSKYYKGNVMIEGRLDSAVQRCQ